MSFCIVPMLGLQEHTTAPQFFVASEGPCLGPHTCIARILLAGPSCQSSEHFYSPVHIPIGEFEDDLMELTLPGQVCPRDLAWVMEMSLPSGPSCWPSLIDLECTLSF